jgi:glycosyltransferase involved in cell wall biosynthesis
MNSPARLLHVGDLRPVKDQTLLLRAAALMRDSHVSFELDMVGYDTMNGAMQELASDLGISSQVRWHGVLRRAALRELMESADVLLVTSRHDAGPLVVLEAAIAGVPTVGTAVGHIVDWAPEGAVCVHDNLASTFAAAVMQLLGDEPRRLAIAHEAQRRAVEIDADFTTTLFESMYDDVTALHRSHSAPAPLEGG